MMNDGTCHDCPEGTTCDSVGNELRSLLLQKDYYRTTRESTEVYPCSSEFACQGGNGTGGALCNDGYEGVLCYRSVLPTV